MSTCIFCDSVACRCAMTTSIARPAEARALASFNAPQPSPTAGEGPEVWPLIYDSTALVLPDWLRADMRERHQLGVQRYGVGLRVWNGRDAVVDAYQEALDLVVYATQARLRLAGDEPLELLRPGKGFKHGLGLDLVRHQTLQHAVWLGELARAGKVPVSR